MKTADPPIPQTNGCSRYKSHKFDMSHALFLFPTDCQKLTKVIRNCNRKVPVAVCVISHANKFLLQLSPDLTLPWFCIYHIISKKTWNFLLYFKIALQGLEQTKKKKIVIYPAFPAYKLEMQIRKEIQSLNYIHN